MKALVLIGLWAAALAPHGALVAASCDEHHSCSSCVGLLPSETNCRWCESESRCVDENSVTTGTDDAADDGGNFLDDRDDDGLFPRTNDDRDDGNDDGVCSGGYTESCEDKYYLYLFAIVSGAMVCFCLGTCALRIWMHHRTMRRYAMGDWDGPMGAAALHGGFLDDLMEDGGDMSAEDEALRRAMTLATLRVQLEESERTGVAWKCKVCEFDNLWAVSPVPVRVNKAAHSPVDTYHDPNTTECALCGYERVIARPGAANMRGGKKGRRSKKQASNQGSRGGGRPSTTSGGRQGRYRPLDLDAPLLDHEVGAAIASTPTRHGDGGRSGGGGGGAEDVPEGPGREEEEVGEEEETSFAASVQNLFSASFWTSALDLDDSPHQSTASAPHPPPPPPPSEPRGREPPSSRSSKRSSGGSKRTHLSHHEPDPALRVTPTLLQRAIANRLLWRREWTSDSMQWQPRVLHHLSQGEDAAVVHSFAYSFTAVARPSGAWVYKGLETEAAAEPQGLGVWNDMLDHQTTTVWRPCGVAVAEARPAFPQLGSVDPEAEGYDDHRSGKSEPELKPGLSGASIADPSRPLGLEELENRSDDPELGEVGRQSQREHGGDEGGRDGEASEEDAEEDSEERDLGEEEDESRQPPPPPQNLKDLTEVASLPLRQKQMWLLEQLSLLQPAWCEGHVELHVRRKPARLLLKDSMAQWGNGMSPATSRFRLRVNFEGEPAIDAGGPMREWFTLVAEAMVQATVQSVVTNQKDGSDVDSDEDADDDEGKGVDDDNGEQVGGIGSVNGNVRTVASATPLFLQDALGCYAINPACSEPIMRAIASGGDPVHVVRANAVLGAFEFLGRLIAKAVMEQQTLALPFSHSFFKLLMGAPVGMCDVALEEPQLAHSMLWLAGQVRQAGDDKSVGRLLEELGIGWEVNTLWGSQVSLAPVETATDVGAAADGEAPHAPPLTRGTVDAYIAARVRWHVVGAVAPQMWAVARGFYSLLPWWLTAPLDHAELYLTVSGRVRIDVNDWMNNTEYYGAYEALGPKHRVIKWFWDVVASMSSNEQSRFLQFVTGSAQAPALGFAMLTSNDGAPRKFAIDSITPTTTQTRASSRSHARRLLLRERRRRLLRSAQASDPDALLTTATSPLMASSSSSSASAADNAFAFGDEDHDRTTPTDGAADDVEAGLGSSSINKIDGFPMIRAHTCFNKLDLPLYRSEEQLRAGLAMILALDATGFTMD